MGTVIWFTGLSGSGKTTIASKLKIILEMYEKSVFLLDGDVARSTINKHLGFTRSDVRENNYRIACFAKEKIKEFDFVLACVMSPFKEDRERAKSVIGNENILEIFVNASIEECIKRDVKGLYKKALAGEIDNMVGIDPTKPYQIPEEPHLEMNTMFHSSDENIEQLISFLKIKSLI